MRIMAEDTGIVPKRIGEMLVASIGFKGEFKEIAPKFETLLEHCADYICGPACALYDYGVYTDGVYIEACFPVTQKVETDEIKSRILEGVEVLSVVHHGSYEKRGESYQKLYRYISTHGIAATAFAREIYVDDNPENPEENVTEIQAVLHRWDNRFAAHTDQVLGIDARKEIMKGSNTLFTLESGMETRTQWLKAAIERLDALADDDEKFEILSQCAHEFSEKRIGDLRAIYEETGSVDEVLKAMGKDPAWYENPKREQNIIYVTKVPYNREGYEEAESKAEKKMHYCHCPLVRTHLEEGISPTFCYCGAGWYRQLWEGILGVPVQVTIVRSLLKGDDECEFAIHIPSDFILNQ